MEAAQTEMNDSSTDSQLPNSSYIWEVGNKVIEVCDLPEPPPREWYVEGLVPSGVSTGMVGDGGVGKSYVAVGIGTHVVCGLDFVGRKVKQGRVLYVDAELDLREFVRRANQIARGMYLDKPPRGLFYYRLLDSLSKPATIRMLENEVHKYRIDLTIIDSFTIASSPLNVSKAEEILPVLKGLAMLGTVIVLDHIPKPQPGSAGFESRAFGSTFKYNMARSVISVSKKNGAIILNQTKSNFGAQQDPLSLEPVFSTDAVRYELLSSDDPRLAAPKKQPNTASLVITLLNSSANPMSVKDIAHIIERAESSVSNALTWLKDNGAVEQAEKGTWRAIPMEERAVN